MDNWDGPERWADKWGKLMSWALDQQYLREKLKLGSGGQTGPINDLIRHTFERTGAHIMGRRMFDGGERGWPEEAPFHTPVFVLTHEKRKPWPRPGGTTFYFVNDGAKRAQALARDTDMTAAELQQHLRTAGIPLNRQQVQPVRDALAVAADHAQTQVPVRGWLLSDDAPVYDHLTATHARCWVHDWRHYARLSPCVPHHQAARAAYGKRYWTFYRALLAYQQAPTSEEPARLEDTFDALVEDETGYAALDDRISTTADKRAQLLAVLQHPDIPLHNNAMELAARRRVRKRDVSFGPQSRDGARAWDTFQTLAATAAKLGVGFFHYLRDRIVTPETTPTIAERVAQRAGVAVPSVV